MATRRLLALISCCATAYADAEPQRPPDGAAAVRRRAPDNPFATSPTVTARRAARAPPATAPAAATPSGGDGGVDFFLLSGQSNAVGVTTGELSIGGNATYWLEVKGILANAEGRDAAAMEEALRVLIYDAHVASSARCPPPSLANTSIHLARETMALYDARLLDDLDAPLDDVNCSFVTPQDGWGVEDASGGPRPLSWDAGCGDAFGHELTLGRALAAAPGRRRPLEVVKNARGGRKIHHWYPGHGDFWPALHDSIASRTGRGTWRAVIWHQGFQEHYGEDEDTSLTYQSNLTGLIGAVRTAMFAASAPGAWRCPAEIPAVVVHAQPNPGSDRIRRVRDAQARFVAADPRAALATLDDLSPFFHYEATSFLVGGWRIAAAYREAAWTRVRCPGDPGKAGKGVRRMELGDEVSAWASIARRASASHVPSASSSATPSLSPSGEDGSVPMPIPTPNTKAKGNKIAKSKPNKCKAQK